MMMMMKTFAIVPVKKFENAKTRLSPVLRPDERVRLSSLMLTHTLKVLAAVPSLQQIVVVSSDRRAGEIAAKHSAKFLREEKESDVNSAVMLAEQLQRKGKRRRDNSHPAGSAPSRRSRHFDGVRAGRERGQVRRDNAVASLRRDESSSPQAS